MAEVHGKKIKFIIIVLVVLLGLNLTALAGVVIYGHFSPSKDTSVVIDNYIEKTNSIVSGEKSAGIFLDSNSSVRWACASNIDLFCMLPAAVLSETIIESDSIGETVISLYKNHAEAYSVAYVTYIVEEGVSVEELALYYEVAREVILAFNGIEELTAGEELKIPGVSADTETYAKADEEPVIPEEQEEEKEEPDVKEDSQEDKSSADKPADQTPPPTGASEDETSSAEEEEQSDEEPVPGDNTSGQSVTDESEEETSSAEVPEGTDEGVSSDMENVINE